MCVRIAYIFQFALCFTDTGCLVCPDPSSKFRFAFVFVCLGFFSFYQVGDRLYFHIRVEDFSFIWIDKVRDIFYIKIFTVISCISGYLL